MHTRGRCLRLGVPGSPAWLADVEDGAQRVPDLDAGGGGERRRQRRLLARRQAARRADALSGHGTQIRRTQPSRSHVVRPCRH